MGNRYMIDIADISNITETKSIYPDVVNAKCVLHTFENMDRYIEMKVGPLSGHIYIHNTDNSGNAFKCDTKSPIYHPCYTVCILCKSYTYNTHS